MKAGNVDRMRILPAKLLTLKLRKGRNSVSISFVLWSSVVVPNWHENFATVVILVKADAEIVSTSRREEVYVPSSMTTPSQVIAECQEKAKQRVAAAPGNSAEADSALDKLMACVETGMSQPILAANDEVLFHSSIREDIALHMENFTCVDENLDTTPDVDTRGWTSDKDGKTRTIHVKLDRPASRIHVIITW
jgi:hypothetical protein